MVQIFTDGDRPIRPLLIAENGKLLFNQKINDFILKNKCSWENFTSEFIIKIYIV